eukprot:TRINITY_DN19860_c0_g1_i1.p2 TRINITY_DN19860_c0_g1~~TRINITY_DN19860_c0_g1_i1.p2  ORF type:complete len:123 (-),score=35.86 TRINITY_DN19860_c0_g1_i1:2-370(-)
MELDTKLVRGIVKRCKKYFAGLTDLIECYLQETAPGKSKHKRSSHSKQHSNAFLLFCQHKQPSNPNLKTLEEEWEKLSDKEKEVAGTVSVGLAGEGEGDEEGGDKEGRSEERPCKRVEDDCV